MGRLPIVPYCILINKFLEILEKGNSMGPHFLTKCNHFQKFSDFFAKIRRFSFNRIKLIHYEVRSNTHLMLEHGHSFLKNIFYKIDNFTLQFQNSIIYWFYLQLFRFFFKSFSALAALNKEFHGREKGISVELAPFFPIQRHCWFAVMLQKNLRSLHKIRKILVL